MATAPTVTPARGLVLATAGLAVLLTVLLPQQAPAGWHSPVMALELARTPTDLAFLAGDDAAPLRTAMRIGHGVDLLFPFAYGGLLVAAGRRQQGPVGALAQGAGALAIVADLVENAVIFWLLRQLDLGPVETVAAALPALFVATWSKWLAIAVAFVALGVGPGRPTPAGAWMILAALPAPAALLLGSPASGETMGSAVVIGFLAVAIRVWPRLQSEIGRSERRP